MKLRLLLPILLISQLTHAQVVSCGPGTKVIKGNTSAYAVRKDKNIATAEMPVHFGNIEQVSGWPARVSVSSVRDGLWSDAGTWGGLIPGPNDVVTINHRVIIDKDATVAGMNIAGSLIFIDGRNVTLQSSKNIIVTGLIVAKPFSNVVNTIRFININEDKFIGGGEDPMDSDVGLWVMGAGKLDLQGSQKTGWTNALSGILANSVSGGLEVKKPAPLGWQIGDELMITPTAAKDYSNFDVVTIKAIEQASLMVSGPISAHPLINNKWTSEVCNLTRNVRIEGTSTGKSHVFIRSAVPQNIQYVQFRYMGPRKQQAGDSAEEFLLGRYGIHFHHCGDGSRGSVIEGCVVRDCDSHSYVTHGSHGVTVHNSIAANVTEDAFWWDQGPEHASHDTKWIHNVAALVKYVPRAIDPTNSYGDPTLSARGFLLGHGDGNVCDSNVAVGTTGDPHDGGGFKWEAVNNDHLEGVWKFRSNLSHNCNTGFITWQNVQMNHVIEDYTAYNNSIGVFHGAYVNAYKYIRGELYNNPFVLHAGSSNQARLRVEDLTVDAAGQDYAVIMESNSETGAVPILIRNLKATNYKKAAVLDSSMETVHSADIIQSDGVFRMSRIANAGEVLRVQSNTGGATKITRTSSTATPNFAPTPWGTGTGLLGEYFNNPDFTSPALTRIDSYIGFSEWYGTQSQIHYAIKYSTYSVRWTGKIQPQFTEVYKITATTNNNGAKLYIGGQLVTGSIAMVAGKLYDIKIEYIKASSARSGISLLWTSPSLELFTKGGEYVPQSQLYPPDSSPPPVNRPPTVSAGQDVTIQLPTNKVTLTGVANDPDGTVIQYNWQKISGGNAIIIPIATGSANFVELGEGSYAFRLSATDDKGAIGFDDVNVTVKAAPVNQPPTLTVSTAVTVTKTGVITLISDAKDPEGGTLTYKWRFIDGPATAVIANPSSAVTTTNTLPSGTYTFELEVTDNSGNKVVKTVSAVI